MNAPKPWIVQLHNTVDQLVAGTERSLPRLLHCRLGCSSCCVDELTVFEIEADLLRAQYPELFSREEPAPKGQCALLASDGSCRVYEHRPYVCRTQGLPLRWLETDATGPYEARDVCPLNLEAVGSLENLQAEQCWTIGPVEDRLQAAQAKKDGGEGRRVALRSLFQRIAITE